MRYTIIRVHIITATSKAEAWQWLREATPEMLEHLLDFQTIKAVEENGWVGAVVKQITGK